MKLTKLQAEILNVRDDIRELKDIKDDLKSRFYKLSNSSTIKDELLRQLLLQKTQADLIIIDRIYLMLLDKQNQLFDEYDKENENE